MLAIIDYRAPEDAVHSLNNYVDDLLLFNAEAITYNSISGHPDIFIYQDDKNLIVAPNSPPSLMQFFKKHKVIYNFGVTAVGDKYNNSVAYNCISTGQFYFHKEGLTDARVVDTNKNKELINLPQAYTRCSLSHLGNNNFITSDKGIEKVLLKNNFNCFYFSPEHISIHDHEHGFFGGTTGILNNKIFFIGNIDLHEGGVQLRFFIENLGLEIVTLNNDLLYDGGGIFFIDNK